MCSSPGVTWNISGFGTGISDTTDRPTAAFFYAPNNNRVVTTDNSTLSDPSTLTFQQLGYADNNAVVTCLDSSILRSMTGTIQIGELALNYSHTKSMLHLPLPFLSHNKQVVALTSKE